MENLLQFFVDNEIWIYLIIGFLGFLYLRKIVMALQEWRSAIFGLEKEYAQRRFGAAMSIVLLLLVVAFAEFFFVTFIAPSYPKLALLTTPTMDLLATQMPTLEEAGAVIPNSMEDQTEVTAAPSDGCIAEALQWKSPVAGEQISGVVQLSGTVNLDNIGFYKYEYSSTGGERWVTIAASTQKGVDLEFGIWDTSQVVPGDYLLRLLVTDNQSEVIPPCVIPVQITSP